MPASHRLRRARTRPACRRGGARRCRAGRSRRGPGRPRSDPAPTRPAMPTISPARTRERDVAEDSPRPRPLTSSRASPIGRLDLGKQRHRPADHVPDEVGGRQRRPSAVTTWRPSRKTVARSHSAKTSSSRWLTNRTATPRSRVWRTIAKSARDLVRRERRGRLVEDEDARVDGQRLGDLDELLVGHREAADDRARRRSGRRGRRRCRRRRGASPPSRSSEARPAARGP